LVNDRNKGGTTRGAAVATANRTSAQDFVRGVITEMRRVTWPTREEWISATILTIVLVVVIGVFVYLLDQAFGWIINYIHPAVTAATK
jgi:preprotein translocase subunit SecE